MPHTGHATAQISVADIWLSLVLVGNGEVTSAQDVAGLVVKCTFGVLNRCEKRALELTSTSLVVAASALIVFGAAFVAVIAAIVVIVIVIVVIAIFAAAAAVFVLAVASSFRAQCLGRAVTSCTYNAFLDGKRCQEAKKPDKRKQHKQGDQHSYSARFARFSEPLHVAEWRLFYTMGRRQVGARPPTFALRMVSSARARPEHNTCGGLGVVICGEGC